jgi:D-alanine-D-alanine ligase
LPPAMMENWKAVTGPWMIKPAFEDASVGIDEDSVVRQEAEMDARIATARERFPTQPILVETFVDGREFNVSVLGAADGPRVLPPAEMTFRDYPPGKEKVMGYRAKWTPGTFEFTHTSRTFEFPAEDEPLLARIRAIAQQCWHAFDLRGYARVDMRLDQPGNIHVLEINGNPCLSSDAGLAAAATHAGFTPGALIELILEDSVCPNRGSEDVRIEARRETARVRAEGVRTAGVSSEQ